MRWVPFIAVLVIAAATGYPERWVLCNRTVVHGKAIKENMQVYIFLYMGYIYVCVCVCMYIYMYVCVCMYIYICMCVCVCVYIYIYRVSQEKYARLREGVPYVKVYRYNPKHVCPKLNGYGDNGQRKVWYSGGSTHCTCQLTA